VAVPEARTALEESMRRVASIALVHDTLSGSIDEEIDFDAIVDRLLGMLADVTGAGAQVALRRDGTFGEIPVEIATTMVLVITELVQNALEHAFPDDLTGSVLVQAERRRGVLTVSVLDDGAGLPADFHSASSDQLGLQIVRTLVSAELSGEFELTRRADTAGAAALVRMPMGRRPRVGG